jgi:hypothetical protein
MRSNMLLPITQPLNAGTPAFDAVGGGGNYSSALTNPYMNLSWTHTAAGNGVLVFNDFDATNGQGNVTATYGGRRMTSLGVFNYSGVVYMMAWGLLYPPPGLQTVNLEVSAPGNSQTYVVTANSVSYTNVSGFGTMATSSGTTTTPSITVSSAAGQMVAAAIGSTTTATNMTGFNQSSRWNESGAVYLATIIGDASGASSVTFSATATAGGWGCVGVPIL